MLRGLRGLTVSRSQRLDWFGLEPYVEELRGTLLDDGMGCEGSALSSSQTCYFLPMWH